MAEVGISGHVQILGLNLPPPFDSIDLPILFVNALLAFADALPLAWLRVVGTIPFVDEVIRQIVEPVRQIVRTAAQEMLSGLTLGQRFTDLLPNLEQLASHRFFCAQIWNFTATAGGGCTIPSMCED